MDNDAIPVIDFKDFDDNGKKKLIAAQIHKACTEHGFFYVSGHGVSTQLQARLVKESKQFFNLTESEKMNISMDKGGRAWRGYFPVNAELTSGKPDRKEGIYFGTELGPEHASVKARLPLHGANLSPGRPVGFAKTVLDYMDEVGKLGHIVLRGVALSLGLEENYFNLHYTQDPLILFRIFHYPAQAPDARQWGVGKHTDYGLLTMLMQDEVGGLQIHSKGQWIAAPPVPNTFICNIGDMLERITGGLYKSTPHRVLNESGRGRLSFPLFFDPSFDAAIKRIENIPATAVIDDGKERWDKTNVHDFTGTYGDYLLNKIGKVFPDLRKDVL
jgi:isopenicillin N synthase-like dioxygenase